MSNNDYLFYPNNYENKDSDHKNGKNSVKTPLFGIKAPPSHSGGYELAYYLHKEEKVVFGFKPPLPSCGKYELARCLHKE